MEVIKVTTWEKKLLDQIRQNYKPYTKVRIDLSIARANHQLDLCGNSLVVSNMSNPNNTSTIRLNKAANDELDLFDGLEIDTVFNTIFFSNTAQAGQWLELISGVEFSYKKKVNDVPSGTIAFWSGEIVDIPAGWHLCDGTNGTPNLIYLFIIGAGGDLEVGATNPNPIHNHRVQGNTASNLNSSGATAGGYLVAKKEHTHSVDIESDYMLALPPWYALAYIMKL